MQSGFPERFLTDPFLQEGRILSAFGKIKCAVFKNSAAETSMQASSEVCQKIRNKKLYVSELNQESREKRDVELQGV